MAGADVVVVGGGVVGCAVAYELARAGARAVVLERDQVASGASSAAAGMLVPLAEVHAPGPFFDFCLAGLRRFDAVVEELRAESGVEVEYVRSGLLKVAFTAEQEAELRAALTWQQARGLAVTWLDRQDALALEPKVSEEVRGALFTTEGGHVNAERLTQALAQAAARKGAMVLQGKAVVGFVVEGSRVVGVRLPDEVWSADHVVVAAGAWTAEA
ncbi:MAG TPA: FAD-dependent oxidoreductase, partial [Chloroflexota bacterium]